MHSLGFAKSAAIFAPDGPPAATMERILKTRAWTRSRIDSGLRSLMEMGGRKCLRVHVGRLQHPLDARSLEHLHRRPDQEAKECQDKAGR
jgi:hypothetical protein